MQPDFLSNPEVREIESSAGELVLRAQAITIASPLDYSAAGEQLTAIKGRLKRIEEVRTSITKPLNETLRKINEFFSAPKAQLEEAERTVKRTMVAYDQKVENERREAQRKADEAAAAERRRQEAAAAEARRKAQDEAARLAREAAEKRAAEEKALREAEEAERAGNRAAAEAARAEAERAAKEAAKLDVRAEAKVEKAEAKAADLELAAASVVSTIVDIPKAAAAGVSGRENWRAEVTDLRALVQAVAAGQAPLSLLQANDKVIGQQARSLKAEFNVPGVRVWAERGIAARSA
jgi:membrane protein involved in colicin uptake